MFNNAMEQDCREGLQGDENIVLIDVRTEGEHRMGHIPNSLLLDIFRPDFIQQIEQMDRNKKYFIYCRSGARSANACSVMSQMGFTDLTNLFGGVLDWRGELVSMA